MNRIAIIGGSGTGKTTLANNLSRKLDIPVCHIDGIHHLEDWQIRDKDERDTIILEKIKEDKWIIDGTYTSTLKQRLERADFVIYLDYSTFAQLRGILGRYFRNHGREKAEIPGCKERMTWHFFWFVVKWRSKKTKALYDEIEKIDNSKVHIFKNRKQLQKWYKDTFGEDIKY